MQIGEVKADDDDDDDDGGELKPYIKKLRDIVSAGPWNPSDKHATPVSLLIMVTSTASTL